MAFDTTTEVLQRRVIMDIALSGSTLRYSDENVALSDNTFYEKRILSFPVIQMSLGRILNPEFRRPGIAITLDNSDGTLTTLFNNNDKFAGKQITLKVGHGTTAADYTTIFVGCRRFPGGAAWNDNTLSLAIEWDLKADMRSLPRQKFFVSTYPRMEKKSKFLSIPWIYGDFRKTVLHDLRVPCYQIDRTEGTGGRFKIAEELQDIQNVYLNGAVVSFTASAGDKAIGEFVLDVAYDPEVDTVEAHVLGATTATFAGAGAEFSLPRLAYDMLTNAKLIGLPPSRINVTAFADWETALPANTVGRRWIGSATAGGSLLAQLLADGNSDLYFNGQNEYTPIYRKKSDLTGFTTFREADLAPRGAGERSFSVEVDPERVYANVIFGDYARKAVLGEDYGAAVTDEAGTQITAVGARHSRRLQMGWLYTAAAADPRTQQELSTFSREVEVVRLRLGPPGLSLNLTDFFRLAHDRYELSDNTGSVFQVRELTHDYARMEAEVVGWSSNNPLTWGTWTNDAAPNWATATAAQRKSQGFWTDDNGLADPADSTSGDSDWF